MSADDPFSTVGNALCGTGCEAVASEQVAMSIQGPYTVGWLLMLILYGAALSQYMSYFSSELYTRDTTRVKTSVWTTFLFLSVTAAVHVYEVFFWTTSPHRSEEALNSNITADSFAPIPGAVVGLVVQAFLARRSWICIPNARIKKAFGWIMGGLVILTFLANLLFAALNFLYQYDMLDLVEPFDFNISLSLFLWLTAVTDVLISASLFFSLRKSLANFNIETDSALQYLSLLSLRTGFQTAILGVAGAITGSVFPDAAGLENVPNAFWLPLPSLYALSLIANVTARDKAVKHAQSMSRSRQGYTAGSVAVSMEVHTSAARGDDYHRRSLPALPTSSISRPPGSVGFFIVGRKHGDAEDNNREIAAIAEQEEDEMYEKKEISGWMEASRKAKRKVPVPEYDH